MPRIADFVAIQDHGSTIPPSDGGLNDVEFPPFDAPGASGAPAILAFRLETLEDIELQAALNGTNLFVRQIQSGTDRSWHEVISTPGLVKTDDNNLVIAVTKGQAVVSDVVLFYQREVSPVAAAA
jgi:hypothetical protein